MAFWASIRQQFSMILGIIFVAVFNEFGNVNFQLVVIQPWKYTYLYGFTRNIVLCALIDFWLLEWWNADSETAGGPALLSIYYLLIYLNNVFLGVPGEAGRIPSPRVTGPWPLHRLRTCGLHFPHSSAHLLDSDVHFPGSTAFFSYQPQSLKSLAPRFTPQAWCYGILGIISATVFNDFGHHFRCSF